MKTNWKYFLCLNCESTLKTTVDNPDHHINCTICGHGLFTEITKEDYDLKRQGGNSENGD